MSTTRVVESALPRRSLSPAAGDEWCRLYPVYLSCGDHRVPGGVRAHPRLEALPPDHGERGESGDRDLACKGDKPNVKRREESPDLDVGVVHVAPWVPLPSPEEDLRVLPRTRTSVGGVDDGGGFGGMGRAVTTKSRRRVRRDEVEPLRDRRGAAGSRQSRRGESFVRLAAVCVVSDSCRPVARALA